MKIPERKQLLLGSAIVGLIGIFAFGLYKPFQNRIKEVRMAQAEKRYERIKARFEARQLPVLKQQRQEMMLRVGQMDKKIPGERMLGEFLEQIADAMNKHNLKDRLVEPKEEFKTDKCICIPVKMQCSGSIQEIFEFFRTMENFPRLVRIEALQLRNNTDLNGKVTMIAQADIYYRN
jgi:Tfp pilus assembly protein PilO